MSTAFRGSLPSRRRAASRRALLPVLFFLLAALLAGCGSGGSESSNTAPLSPVGTIGVTYDGELWLLAADGSSKHRVTFGADWAGAAAQSPDGRWIVFDTTNGIWVAPAAGGRARLVPGLPTPFTRPSFDASWAPDGRSIVFAGEQGIYRTALSGDLPARLLFRDPTASEPKWSSGGSLIAFVRGRSSRPERRAIWVMGADGGHPHRLAYGDEPAFSPNGARLAYLGAAGVYLLRLESGRRWLFARGGYQPVWSPHGVYLAYKHKTSECSDAGCQERIWIVRSSGGVAVPLEPEFFDSGDLTWTDSPPPSKTVSIKLPD